MQVAGGGLDDEVPQLGTEGGGIEGLVEGMEGAGIVLEHEGMVELEVVDGRGHVEGDLPVGQSSGLPSQSGQRPQAAHQQQLSPVQPHGHRGAGRDESGWRQPLHAQREARAVVLELHEVVEIGAGGGEEEVGRGVDGVLQGGNPSHFQRGILLALGAGGQLHHFSFLKVGLSYDLICVIQCGF